MRKPNPEPIAPICPNCQAIMFIYGDYWKCRNRFECGGMPIPYPKKKKVIPKKINLPYKE